MDGLEMIEMLEALNVKDICIETSMESEDQMIEANADQLSQGIRRDGSDIEPPYTQFTIFEKEKKSGLAAITDVVTLFDTGSHYAKLFAKTYPDGTLEHGSKDEKSEDLQEKYGDDIYGLTEESKEALIEDYIEPRFQGKIERTTGLEFN